MRSCVTSSLRSPLKIWTYRQVKSCRWHLMILPTSYYSRDGAATAMNSTGCLRWRWKRWVLPGGLSRRGPCSILRAGLKPIWRWSRKLMAVSGFATLALGATVSARRWPWTNLIRTSSRILIRSGVRVMRTEAICCRRGLREAGPINTVLTCHLRSGLILFRPIFLTPRIPMRSLYKSCW